jgi:myo-inositol catabolism protein IolC
MVLSALVVGVTLAAGTMLMSLHSPRQVLDDALPVAAVIVPMVLGWALGRLSSCTEV